MAGKRKGTYRITNWRKYNESLVQRGSITFWFSDDVIDRWHGADHRYFKVEGADSATYIIRQDIPTQTWELTMFERAALSGEHARDR